jgi:intracellular sulfur oxidation DsrE/DsrF family protein
MIKFLFPFVVVIITLCSCMGTSSGIASREKAMKDSVVHAKKLADSLKMAKLFSIAQYPYIKGGKWSGVIPVADPTEIPDPNHDYKLLFELTAKNPDSLSKDINNGLSEVARVLNLHFASGIPANKIIPVVVIHGPGIEAVMNNESYKKRHSLDNPNIKLVHDLENAGSKIIVCGQAMAFFEMTREELLPEIKISLTAQTVLSNYQSQGFVLYPIVPDK